MRRKKAQRLKFGFAAAALLLLATFLLFVVYDGYADRGGNLVPNLDFADGLAGWTAEGKVEVAGPPEGRAVLAVAEPQGSARLVLRFPPPGVRFVRLSAELRTEGVSAGRSAEDRARFLLLGLDSSGKHLSQFPHKVAELEGTREWRRYERVFPIEKTFAEMAIVLELNHATGRLEARGISLVETAPKPLFSGLRWALGGLWAVFLFWLLSRFLPTRRRRFAHVLLLFAAALILAGTLAPKYQEAKLAEAIAGFFARSAPQAPPEALPPKPAPPEASPLAAPEAPPAPQAPPAASLDGHLMGKLAHLASFALLGLALGLARAEAGALLLFAGLALAAAGSEALQEFTPGRDPLLADVGLDLAGASFGLALALVRTRLARPSRRGRR